MKTPNPALAGEVVPNRSSLLDLLPAASRAALDSAQQEPFRSEHKLPKHANRYLVAKAVDKLVRQEAGETEALNGLTRSEREYVLLVVAEFRAWRESREKDIKKTAEAVQAEVV